MEIKDWCKIDIRSGKEVVVLDTNHIHYNLILQHLKSRVIEYFDEDTQLWVVTSEPKFEKDKKYRVQPNLDEIWDKYSETITLPWNSSKRYEVVEKRNMSRFLHDAKLLSEGEYLDSRDTIYKMS